MNEELVCEGCGKQDKTVKARWVSGTEFIGALILCDECAKRG